MKKTIIIIGTLLLIGMVGLMWYKIHTYNSLYIEEVDFDKSKIFEKTIKVDYTVNTPEEDLLTYNNLTMKNYFKDYNLTLTDTENYYGKKDNSWVMISRNYQAVYTYNIFGYESTTEDNGLTINEFFQKENIKNDIDLWNYVKDHYYMKTNIFTSVKRMEECHTINFFALELGNLESIDLIEGKLTGFILNYKNNDVKEIHLLNNDEYYSIALSGDDITSDSFIKELLETVVIQQVKRY